MDPISRDQHPLLPRNCVKSVSVLCLTGRLVIPPARSQNPNSKPKPVAVHTSLLTPPTLSFSPIPSVQNCSEVSRRSCLFPIKGEKSNILSLEVPGKVAWHPPLTLGRTAFNSQSYGGFLYTFAEKGHSLLYLWFRKRLILTHQKRDLRDHATHSQTCQLHLGAVRR